MGNSIQTSFLASDRSYLAILKKDIRDIVAQTQLSAKRQAEVDIVVAEMSSNLVKHGGGGEMIIRVFDEEDNQAVELLSIDNGRGIGDISKMAEDGMSTTNTLGQGLGAIKRLSDESDIYSIKDWGTIVLSRIYRDELPINKKRKTSEFRSIVLPKPREVVSGDGYYIKTKGKEIKILICDGLGHGVEANKAMNEAVNAFKICPDESPVEIVRFIHNSVKKTRGLVATVAIYNIEAKQWRFCGVGNIATRLVNNISVKNQLPYNGIIGMNVPTTMKDQEVGHEHGQVLVMCSDGIKTRWDTQKYPSIFRHDLSIFAAALYKDFARKTDDMSIVVGRIK